MGSTLGELRQRMAATWQEAKANGYELEEVIPPDMKSRCQEVKALQQSKDFIRDLEEREKFLLSTNEGLIKALAIEKKKIEDLPADHKQLEIDVQQLKRQSDFYCSLMNDAEGRASQYQDRWQKAVEQQKVGAATQNRIEILEKECAEQKAVIFKLLEENRDTAEIYNSLREQDEVALQEKDSKLEAMQKFVGDAQQRYRTLEEESEGFETTFHDLVLRMENENVDAADAVNKATQRMRTAEQLKNATVSEAKILRTYYESSSKILRVYQQIFGYLLSLDNEKIMFFPPNIQDMLRSAGKECEAFDVMHEAMQVEGILEDEVRQELSALAASAKSMQANLQVIGGDVARFLSGLSTRPARWSFVKRKFR